MSNMKALYILSLIVLLVFGAYYDVRNMRAPVAAANCARTTTPDAEEKPTDPLTAPDGRQTI